MKMTARKSDDMHLRYILKGTKMRTEMAAAPDKKGRTSPGFASIVDWKTREMIMLMPEQKMYMVHQLPDLTEEAEKSGKNSDVEFTPTGRKEKIAGVEAEEYVGVSDGKRTEVWVTKELGKFMMANQGQSGGGLFSKNKNKTAGWQKFMERGDFFALRVIQRAKEGAPEEFRMEVEKIDRSAQPDALFAPPADYQKFEAPNMKDMLKGMVPGR